MNNLSCKNCGREVTEDNKTCPHCGIPLPPDHGQQRYKKFILWFIVLILYCFFIIIWLPPDWTSFVGE